MILALVSLLMAQSTAHSGVNFKIENVDVVTAPYIVAYAQCFEDAAVATKTLSSDEKRRRYDACRATRLALTKRFESVKTRGHLRAARNFEISLNEIELAFAKPLTSATQTPDKSIEAAK